MPAQSSRYRLVFRGKYLPGLTPEQVVANLAELFHVTPAQVEESLATIPAVIKQDIDLDTGNRYLEVLAEAGLITHLESLEAAAEGWDGVERRQGTRRTQPDRRATRRDAAIRPDRRGGRGRRKTDQ